MIPKFYKPIDLSNLPKNNNKIQWTKSVGCSIPFQYRDICGELIITGYKHSIVTLKFNDTEFEIRVPHLIQLKIMTSHGIYDALSKKTKSHRNYKLMRYVDYVQFQKEEKN